MKFAGVATGVVVRRPFERVRRRSRVVRERRVASDAEVVLDAAFGRQAVVVPADRVEDLEPAHPLEPGDEVGVRVGHHVADVQRAARRRRRRVDRVDLLAGLRPVEAVGAVGLPPLAPLRLEPVERSASRARSCARVYGKVRAGPADSARARAPRLRRGTCCELRRSGIRTRRGSARPADRRSVGPVPSAAPSARTAAGSVPAAVRRSLAEDVRRRPGTQARHHPVRRRDRLDGARRAARSRAAARGPRRLLRRRCARRSRPRAARSRSSSATR